PAYRLGDEGRDVLGAELLDRCFEHAGTADGTRSAAAAALAAIGIGRGNAVYVHQPRPERSLVRLARGRRQGEQGAAVIAGAEGVDVALAALVDEPAPFAAHDFGILMRQLAVEDVAVGVAIAAHTGEATVATPIGRV